MVRRRQQKEKQSHFCLLVNGKASNYSRRYVKRLAAAIRKSGGHYTIFEPDSAMELLHTAQRVCGLRKWGRAVPLPFSRRGKVTALVACGGDGTFNLVARVAVEANIPVGALPMGATNNVARSVNGTDDADEAIKRIVRRNYRKIDSATVSDQTFFCSAGLGLIPEMARQLERGRRPTFSYGWSQLAAKAASLTGRKKMILKIDAFRFEVGPVILSINLLPYSIGLQLTPASICDDGRAEVIFDVGGDSKVLSTFVRQMSRKKYVCGSDVRLFRGKTISIQPIKGMLLYLDGELIKLPSNLIEVQVGSKQLKVFC